MCPEQSVQTHMYKGRERKRRKGSPKWKGGCKKWIKLSRRGSNSQMIAAKFVRLLSLFDQMFPNIYEGKQRAEGFLKSQALFNHGKNISWHSPEALEGNFRTKLLFSLFPKKERKKGRISASAFSSFVNQSWEGTPLTNLSLTSPSSPPVPLIGNRVAKNKDQSSLVIKYLSLLWSTLYCRCPKQEVERRKTGT